MPTRVERIKGGLIGLLVGSLLACGRLDLAGG